MSVTSRSRARLVGEVSACHRDLVQCSFDANELAEWLRLV